MYDDTLGAMHPGFYIASAYSRPHILQGHQGGDHHLRISSQLYVFETVFEVTLCVLAQCCQGSRR